MCMNPSLNYVFNVGGYKIYVFLHVFFNYVGNATVDSNIANVALTGLNCSTEYTIIAGGMRDGNLIGPKSSYGPIPDYLCRLINILSRAIFTSSEGEGKKYVYANICTHVRMCFIFIVK